MGNFDFKNIIVANLFVHTSENVSTEEAIFLNIIID